MTTFNAKAETVIKDANIITIDPRHPRAQALAMGHGRFLAVGDNDDMEGLIGPGTRVMNLTGKNGAAGVHRRPHPRFEQRHKTRYQRRLRTTLGGGGAGRAA